MNELTEKEKEHILIACSTFDYKETYIKDIEAVMDMVLDALNKRGTHITQQCQPMTVEHIDKSAKKLAECMDYPWEHMTEEGKRNMRDHAKAIIEAKQQMTVEQIKEQKKDWFQADLNPETIFHRGVRAAEAFHGIKGKA